MNKMNLLIDVADSLQNIWLFSGIMTIILTIWFLISNTKKKDIFHNTFIYVCLGAIGMFAGSSYIMLKSFEDLYTNQNNLIGNMTNAVHAHRSANIKIQKSRDKLHETVARLEQMLTIEKKKRVETEALRDDIFEGWEREHAALIWLRNQNKDLKQAYNNIRQKHGARLEYGATARSIECACRGAASLQLAA